MSTRDHVEWAARYGIPIPADVALKLMDEALNEGEPDRVYSTAQASERFGKSEDYWQDAARTGRIEGAWQDANRGPWNLPDSGIRRHLAGNQKPARSVSRGPWRQSA